MNNALAIKVFPQAAVIFLTAVGLGFAYDAVSPLGLHTLALAAVAAEKPAVTMTWQEVKPLLAKGEVVLVDARRDFVFKDEAIPGAVSLPVDMFGEKIGEFAATYPKTTTLVVYCQSSRCGFAHGLAKWLREKSGYLDVREMPGGYVEWMRAELGEATTTAPKKP